MFSWYDLQIFLKTFVTILVAGIITGIILNFRFHIHCISVHKLFKISFFSAIVVVVVVVTACKPEGD
jgi:hypothetical protein